MARCPNCSVENAETQRFCGDCGTPLPASPARNAPDPAADETIPLPTDVLEPGTLFARRYQVIEELGAGGMGCVYRVLDKKVDEEIALKLIKPEVASDRLVLERFSSELKLARQVVHRNVARMFDLSEEGHVPFITMEYVRGENLKRLIRKVGRLAPGQAIPFACQICAGLNEAHRLGIVHRDLKPQNVMIDEDGQARILDFGLARPLSGAIAERRPHRSGTPAYISPEQIRGLAVDARSDLYSLGVILYEMLTGRTPFQADTVQELLDMHLHEPPKDPRKLIPGISMELSAVVTKCLEKDPANRYQSAAEMQTALDCLSRPVLWDPLPPSWLRIATIVGAASVTTLVALYFIVPFVRQKPWQTSLAVLPVEGTGSDERLPSLAVGLQEKITAALSSIPGLRVVPRLSVDSYEIKGMSSPQIGKTLRAKYLLSVKVEAEEDRVDASICLINARRDSFPPPYTYSKNAPDYRALPDEIARYTAGVLGKVIAEDRLKTMSRRETASIEAFNLYLEGMAIIERQNKEEDIRSAIGKYEEAILIDPGYALAYWGAGNAYENLYFEQKEKDPAVLDKMYFYFNKASEIDPTFAETNLGLGWYHFNKGDNPRAYASFKKALALGSGKAVVNRDAGAFLMSIGLYRQAIRRLSKAAELSPRDTLPLGQIAQSWMSLGECEKALLYVEKAIDINRLDTDAWRMYPVLLMLTGRLDEAGRAIGTLEERGIDADRTPYLRELIMALRTDRDQAHVFKNGKPGIAPGGTYAFLLLGLKDEAIANIQAGIDRGFANGMYLYSYPSLVKNPLYKTIRDDPRFQAILKKQQDAYIRELRPLEKL